MKFYIETYGCQMNVSDSELVSSILTKAGWTQSETMDGVDLILFNTCSVRQHAEDRVLGRISNEKHRKTSNPDLKIAVIGCMAQRMGKRLLEEGSGVDFVVGVDQYNLLPQLLMMPGSAETGFDQSQVYPDFKPVHSNHTCAFVTITRGCDNYCSYCIVPFVRGRERSVPFESIYKEVENCGRQGLKDVTLLGQNVNSYSYKGMNFPKLLRELNQIESIYRLRFLTSHPKDLSDDLIQTMASCDKISHHIHLPMQSGDNHILRAMNRKYSYESYYNLTEKLRNAMPVIGLTTDLIAGFPGETEAMFEHTLDAMKSIGFDYAFCFKYSEREGTPASGWPDQVPEEVRLHRLQRMIDLQREITLEKFSAQIGRVVEIYVENLSKKSKRQVSGKTDDFKIAVMTGDESDVGKLKRSKVVDVTAGTLICE